MVERYAFEHDQTMFVNGDDIWLNAMAILKGTNINLIKDNLPEKDLLHFIPKTQRIALWHTNSHPHAPINNDTQIHAVYSHYNIYDILYDSLDKDFVLEKFSILVERNKALKQNPWYLFGQLSRNRKWWTVGKLISKKLGIYWIMSPIMNRLLVIFFPQKVKKMETVVLPYFKHLSRINWTRESYRS